MFNKEVFTPLVIGLIISSVAMLVMVVWYAGKYYKAEEQHQGEMDQAEKVVKEALLDNNRVLDEAEEMTNKVTDLMLAFYDFVQLQNSDNYLGFQALWERLPSELKHDLSAVKDWVDEHRKGWMAL